MLAGRLAEALGVVSEAQELAMATNNTPLRWVQMMIRAWSGDEVRAQALVATEIAPTAPHRHRLFAAYAASVLAGVCPVAKLGS
jgi:hypothetical protein